MQEALRFKSVGRRLLLTLVACVFAEAAVADGEITAELDAYWKRVSSYLAAGDYQGVVSTYHPEAVLVSERFGTSYPISRALERWKPGILDTAAGRSMTFVEFRITRRLYSESTAHEQGIFHFRGGPLDADAGEEEFSEDWVHFEALLRKDGQWRMLMEYQKHSATQAEWAAALEP